MVPPKKSKVAQGGEGQGSGNVDEKLVRSISKIKYIQKELKKINVEEENKVLEVLQKYSAIFRESFIRRNEVLLTIKEFWLTVLFSHPVLSEVLTGEDLKILRYLVSLDVEEHLKLGYSITFNFSPNPYFENEKLTKTYSATDESTAVVTGATIKWKEGMEKGVEDMSFFKWLSRTQHIPISTVALDKIACTIKGCIWPDPLKYILAGHDNNLDGEGAMENVDEEGGHHDDEIEEKEDGESGESDAEKIGVDDDEINGDEEGGEIDTEESGLYDEEFEEPEEDEEGEEMDAEEGGTEDDDDDDKGDGQEDDEDSL